MNQVKESNGLMLASESAPESRVVQALREACHALDTLQGLHAFDAEAPQETFVINNGATLAILREALGFSSPCCTDTHP